MAVGNTTKRIFEESRRLTVSNMIDVGPNQGVEKQLMLMMSRSRLGPSNKTKVLRGAE